MWERNTRQLPVVRTESGDWTLDPDMCPNGELNQWPFPLRGDPQPTESHRSGQSHNFHPWSFTSLILLTAGCPVLPRGASLSCMFCHIWPAGLLWDYLQWEFWFEVFKPMCRQACHYQVSGRDYISSPGIKIYMAILLLKMLKINFLLCDM